MFTQRFRPAGNSALPAIIIISALAVSALVFFLFTRPQLQQQQQDKAAQAGMAPQALPSEPAPGAPAVTSNSPAATQPSTSSAGTPAGDKPVNAPATTATTPPITMTFAQPADAAKQIARAIASGDFAQAAKMAAASDPQQEGAAAAVLEKITKGMGFKIGAEDKIQVLGQAGEATRISIPLIKPGDTLAKLDMQLDLVRDAQTGWRISQFRLPKELQAAIAEAAPAMSAPAATPGAPAAAGSPASTATTPGTAASAPLGAMTPRAGESIAKATPLFTVDNNPDPLGVAHVFVQALLHQDFATARGLVNQNKVPSQKLAGLCIVFEEGDYELKPGKPLVMTIASPLEAWVIAQIKSEKLQQATEFGLEMQREEGKPWQIVGLNLSDLLGSFARSTSRLGVPYTPLVKNPGGGESLALYFEYDQAMLHPRAEKQLEIVAGLLKANATRKLRITGHTDAKGTDDYNMSLSTKRALSVKLKLAALGVSPDQVITEGLGKAEPIGPNQKADGSDDPEGRSRNRRAEIFLDF